MDIASHSCKIYSLYGFGGIFQMTIPQVFFGQISKKSPKFRIFFFERKLPFSSKITIFSTTLPYICHLDVLLEVSKRLGSVGSFTPIHLPFIRIGDN